MIKINIIYKKTFVGPFLFFGGSLTISHEIYNTYFFLFFFQLSESYLEEI